MMLAAAFLLGCAISTGANTVLVRVFQQRERVEEDYFERAPREMAPEDVRRLILERREERQRPEDTVEWQREEAILIDALDEEVARRLGTYDDEIHPLLPEDDGLDF